MDRYYELLKQKQTVNHSIRSYKKILNKQYVTTHKQEIKLLDIALICMIVFNFGAVFLTELMVVKDHAEAGETMKVIEANPTMAKMGGYETTPKANIQFIAFVRTIFIWAILSTIYYYFRNTIISDNGYYIMAAVTIFYIFLTLSDVLNNLGIFVGQVMFF